MNIQEKYVELCETPSDINEHLPVLNALASECNIIAELWVRTAVSDYAICAGMKEGAIFKAYDIVESPEALELEKLCAQEWKNYSFHIDNSMTVDIGVVDMLFIPRYWIVWIEMSWMRRLIVVWNGRLFERSSWMESKRTIYQ